MGALTTALFIVYMLVAPLTGWLGDRFPRKPLIIGGAVLWSLATLATAWVHDYWTLYIRHALVGVGEATFGIFAPAVLADFYPERDRNRILSIFYLAIPVGAALGYLAGGQLGSMWGWRAPFFVCAFPGLVIAALYGWLGREPVRGCKRSRGRRPRSGQRSPGCFGNPAFLTATFGLAALTFAMGGISTWVPTFLHRVAGLSVGMAEPDRERHYGGGRHCRNADGRMDGATLAAHQPSRALPAFVLERGADAALRSAGVLRAAEMGDSFACSRRSSSCF